MKPIFRAKADAAEPVSKGKWADYKKERSDIELDLLDEVLGSRKRAWQITFGALTLMLALAALTAFVIHRYSQPIPPSILVLDKGSGTVQELSMTVGTPSQGEVIDTAAVESFVDHFETYDFNSAQRDYNTVSLMAEPAVAADYAAKWKWGTTDAIDKRVGDGITTRVGIVSTFIDREKSIATVRFTTQEKYRTRSMAEPLQYWIAVLSYKYEPMLMKAKDRQLNPFGFRVKSYRVRAETANRVGG